MAATTAAAGAAAAGAAAAGAGTPRKCPFGCKFQVPSDIGFIYAQAECPICFDNVTKLYPLACKHAFCEACVASLATPGLGYYNPRDDVDLFAPPFIPNDPVLDGVASSFSEGDIAIPNRDPLIDNFPTPWRSPWATIVGERFFHDGCIVFWVYDAFSYYDTHTLISLTDGYPYKGYLPPPAPTRTAGIPRWVRNSVRWAC